MYFITFSKNLKQAGQGDTQLLRRQRQEDLKFEASSGKVSETLCENKTQRAGGWGRGASGRELA
jgi:hypothetical protein